MNYHAKTKPVNTTVPATKSVNVSWTAQELQERIGHAETLVDLVRSYAEDLAAIVSELTVETSEEVADAAQDVLGEIEVSICAIAGEFEDLSKAVKTFIG